MTEHKEPFHFIKGIKKLIPTIFESKYQDIFNPKKKYSFLNLEAWGKELVGRCLIIDLSQVTWVDFGAAAQLTLLIEWTQKKNINVTILLPFTRLSQGEKRHLSELEHINPEAYTEKKILFRSFVKRRRNALNYLENIGFIEAVKCNHITNSQVNFDYEYEFQADREKGKKKTEGIEYLKRERQESEQDIKDPKELGYKNLIPLSWIDKSGKSDYFKDYESLINKILTNAERGIEHIDAKTIINVILSELTKNVAEHANTTHALIGAALQTTNALNNEFHLECEREFFKWFKSSKSNYIAIYFGDTGQGLINTLKKAKKKPTSVITDTDYIHWSFDKWSTSKENEPIRGTKGLYRINRIINKYDGLVTIRTSNTIAGFQKGGYIVSNEIISKKTYALFPGTFLRLHLVPFKEIIKLNINPHYIQTDTGEKKYLWLTKFIELTSVQIDENSFNKEKIQNYFTLNQSHKKITNLLLILQIDTEKINSLELKKEIFKKVFFNLSHVRHPGAIVLYIIGKPHNLSWDLIELEADSQNCIKKFEKESQEIEHYSNEEVHDPVLILGEKRQFCWVGVENKLFLDALNKLYGSSQKSINLEDIIEKDKSTSEVITRLKQFFAGEEALAYLNEKNNINLRFNFRDLKEYYIDKLTQYIHELKESNKPSKDYYLTPNLKLVKNWININDILKDKDRAETFGYAFVLSTLFEEHFPKQNYEPKSKPLKILIDNYECYELAVEFGKFNGIPIERIIKLYEEVDGRLPRRTAIFDEKDRVIILTTIISTRETILRSIKTILRDKAKPIVVISLIDFNKNDNNKNTYEAVWGNKVRVISLYNEITDIQSHSKIEPTFYIEPFTNKKIKATDFEHDEKNQNTKFPERLIEECDALHFNHVGKENGRHFTFYLSAKRLLEKNIISDDSSKAFVTILERYKKEINDWLAKENIKDFEIWKISYEIKHAHPASVISYKLEAQYKSQCKGIVNIQRSGAFGEMNYSLPFNYNSKSKNIIFIDWGTMTGKTIQQVINLTPGIEKTNVLCCILFNQLPYNEHVFLSKLSQLLENIEKPINDQGQQKLFIELKQTKPSISESKISIKFLYDLPLFFYEQVECPVCEHRQALREFVIQAEYMDDFFDKRKEILKIKDRKITDEKPVDFYGEDENHRMSSKQIIKMFEFKLLLKNALTSTHYRNEVRKKILKITDNESNELDNQRKDIDSDLYAILYFLSVEIMWMQKPPLSFKLLREEITKMALAIATWDIQEMKQINGSRDELIIRYKFSAISVLRSSDKVSFINNIENIFKSTYYNEDRVSMSLSQNLFYHIHSYLKRKYHQDKNQLEKIISQLNSILEKYNLPGGILFVVQYLRFFSEQKKIELTYGELDIYETVRSFVNLVNKSFNPKGDGDIERDHNSVTNSYKNKIYPFYLIELIRNHQNLPDSRSKFIKLTSEGAFNAWRNELGESWDTLARNYVNHVTFHLNKMKSLFNTSVFKKYSDLVQVINDCTKNKIYFGYNDMFTLNCINNIMNDSMILLNKNFFDDFINIYNYYLRLFFDYNKYNKSSSSSVISLAYQFPSEYATILEEVIGFSKEKLHNKSIDLKVEKNIEPNNLKLFVPIDLLRELLEQIFCYNIIKHNPQKIVKIFIEYEKTKNEIKFYTYGTSPKGKNDGGLKNALNEIEFYYMGKTSNFYDHNNKRNVSSLKCKIWR